MNRRRPPRRAVRLALHALPAAFRADYGGELEGDLLRRWREWTAGGGWRARAAFWLSLALDLARVALRQRGEAAFAWAADRLRPAARRGDGPRRRRPAWAMPLAYAAGAAIGFVAFCYSPLCPFCP